MSFREHEKRCNEFGRKQALERAPKTPPRPWAEMLVTWGALMGTLCSFLLVPDADQGRRLMELAQRMVGRVPDGGREAHPPLHLAVWRWMWSLPLCSEARKAAFTIGAAALLIERWGEATRVRPLGEAPMMLDLTIGQRAEALLRIAAWHVDDARGEAHGRTLGREPTIPPHERVYHRTADGPGVAFGVPWTSAILGHAILGDHFEHRRGTIKGSPLDLVKQFVELCIASLPDGPWVMTTRDVERFLELILEDS